MQNLIGQGAIKIACIQVTPGHELEVKKKLEKACQGNPKITNYFFLKGCGSFDIILFYAADDFGFHIRQAGPIRHVLKSNLLLCFPYLREKVDDIFGLISGEPFTGLCLLKISPGLRNYHPEIDKMLREYVWEEEAKWALLGSLGWNELIILVSENNIDGIIKQVYGLASLYLNDRDRPLSVVTKTLTFFGINYSFLPSAEIIDKGFNATKSFLETNTPTLKDTTMPTRTSGGSTSIEITCKPVSEKRVEKYFASKGFSVADLSGKKDLLAEPSKEMTWSHFLATILHFRRKFKSAVFATDTRLNLDSSESFPKNTVDLRAHLNPYEFDYADLEKEFGRDIASTLANHFYSMNSLIQNPLCGSVYADMAKYPKYIFDTGRQLNKLGGDSLHLAQGATEVLKIGAELRSYGTYETIEEVTGRFSEFRGGCQLALLAAEFLPSFVLNRVGINWKGFVITGETKFSRVNEVISIPSHSLWNPQEWWALYHEIAHILLDHRSEWLNWDLPEIRQFLSNKSLPLFWFEFIIELVTEVVGFELGLFGNYDRFLELLWEHLARIDPFQRQNVAIESYAIRTFFVKLFLGCFRRYADVEPVSRKEFESLGYLYEELLKHMGVIEDIVGDRLFRDDRFIAAENAKFIKELYPYTRYLSKQISAETLRPKKRALDMDTTSRIMKRLKRGSIWWDDIPSPEGVIYKLLSESNPSFSMRTATILTFWNQQTRRFRRRFS